MIKLGKIVGTVIAAVAATILSTPAGAEAKHKEGCRGTGGLDARAQLLYYNATAASFGGSSCLNTGYFSDFCLGFDGIFRGERTSSEATLYAQEPVVVSEGVQRRTSTEENKETSREYKAAFHVRYVTPSPSITKKMYMGVEMDLLLGRASTTTERTRTSQRYDALENPVGEVNVVEGGADTSEQLVYSLVPSLRYGICHKASICGELGGGWDFAGKAPFGNAGVLYRWR